MITYYRRTQSRFGFWDGNQLGRPVWQQSPKLSRSQIKEASVERVSGPWIANL